MLYHFFLGEMALKELEYPLNLIDIAIIPRDNGDITKATFTGDDCNGDVTYSLKSSSGSGTFDLDSNNETAMLSTPTVPTTYTLVRQLHGSQIGPSSDFIYTPPTTTTDEPATSGNLGCRFMFSVDIGGIGGIGC